MKLRTLFFSFLLMAQGAMLWAQDAFHLGMAGYTFNKFDIDKTLAFMKKIDVHYLCIKDFHLPINANEAQIAEFKKKLADHGVIGYAVGPIYMGDVEAVDKAFAYAQRVGVDLRRSRRQAFAMPSICMGPICRFIPMPLQFGMMSRIATLVWVFVSTSVTTSVLVLTPLRT